jgi:transcriptional regulator with XRE-family HTH domain
VVVIDIAARFGDNLKRVRAAADMSQDDVAIKASVHRTEISQLERGLRIPRIDTVVKLAASLEVTPAELLKGIEWEAGVAVYGRFRES